MPEPKPPTASSGSTAARPSATELTALQTRIAELTLADPGVVELHPTLLASLKRLRSSTDDSLVDLVCHGGEADVEIMLTTTPAHQARAVARRLREEIRTVLGAVGLGVGSLEVMVVSIEAGAPTPAAAAAEEGSAGLGER